jgi:hypothetical protein
MKNNTLNGFRKVSETEDKTILKHESEGHELHLNHAMLSPEHLKVVKEMPTFKDGGEKAKPGSNILSDTTGGTPTSPDNAADPESLAPAPASTPAPATGADAPAQPEQESLLPVAIPSVSADPNVNAQNAARMGIKGIVGQQEAETQKAQGEEAAADQAITADQKQLKKFQAVSDSVDKHHAEFLQDVQDAKIDPNRYTNNMSTGSKISTAIGLFLGGIGAGLTHSENPAEKYLREQVNNDIKSQEADLGKKENLLSANMAFYRDKTSALAATSAMTNKLMADRILKAGAAAGTQMAEARAQQAAAPFLQQEQNSLQMVKFRQAALQGGQSGEVSKEDPALQIPYLVPKEQQAKALDELKDLQNLAKVAVPMDKAWKEAAADNKLQNVAGVKTSGQKAFLSLVNTTVKEIEGTARQAAFKSIEDNIMPQLGDKQETLDRKWQAYQVYKLAHSAAPTLRANHIIPENFESTRAAAQPTMSAKDASAQEFVQKNPDAPEAKQIKALLKSKYGI